MQSVSCQTQCTPGRGHNDTVQREVTWGAGGEKARTQTHTAELVSPRDTLTIASYGSTRGGGPRGERRLWPLACV